MNDRTKIQRNKGDTSTVTNPSLASSTTPTLANPTHSFGLQSTIALPETSVQALSNQQDTQSPHEQLLEGEVFKQQPQGHDISRISLRPQAKLSTSQLGHTYEPEANWLADRKGGIIPEVLQRKCATCEEEEELQRRIDSPIIQRDETSSLPPVPNYQLTPPSLLQPPDPATQYGLGLDLHLQDPQLQAMQHVQQQLNPATIRPILSQINLGLLPTQGVTSAGTPNSTTPIPNPFASPPSVPAASPVPAGAGPNTPRAATAGDLLKAIMAVPAIDGALTSLQTQVGDRISQDWRKLSTGEQIGVVSSLVMIGGGALAGVIADPTDRKLALDQLNLNGRMLPVPGFNWLHLEINTGGDNLMLGIHVDVGRLLPPSLGFGSSSPSAIGSPPQPEPLPGMIQRQEDNTQVGAGEAIAQRIQAASGGGNNLHEGVQQHLEQHLGADLSGVRIHTDSEADRLSRSVNAIAFTTGQDIFFSAGSYNPSSSEGKHLIAHEVVHTVQQANGAVAGNATGNGISISDPSDRFELEAEKIADQLTSIPDTSTQQPVQREIAPEEKMEEEVQTKPLASGITLLVQREAIPEEEEEIQTKPELQRATDDNFQPGASIESQLNTSKDGGSPLGDDVRGFMEPRFGHDFSQVRVHTGGDAVQMNQELGPQAFAHGSDIYFGAGKSPGNNELTAHELTHVVQQTVGDQTQINRKLISPFQKRTEKDWYEPDAIHWAQEMGKLSTTENSFVKAAIFNTQNNFPDEYNTIAQRSAYYDVVDALAAEGILPKKIRFFGAASKVTGSNSVGSIEGFIGWSLHSKEAIQILKDVNKILFESNMKVINRLMHSKEKPIDPKNPESTEAISAMQFDLKMVEMEQGIVETYLKQKTGNISTEAIKDINDDLNFKGFFRTIGEHTLADSKPINWAKQALGKDKLDFMERSDREAIGKALVFSLHSNTQDEYINYLKNGNIPIDRLKEDYRTPFSMDITPK